MTLPLPMTIEVDVPEKHPITRTVATTIEFLRRAAADDEDDGDPVLSEPFTNGAYAYATNGTRAVRVFSSWARGLPAPPTSVMYADKIDGICADVFERPATRVQRSEFAQFLLAINTMTLYETRRCSTCEGDGRCECPECDAEHECHGCGGSGYQRTDEVKRREYKVRGAKFLGQYYRPDDLLLILSAMKVAGVESALVHPPTTDPLEQDDAASPATVGLGVEANGARVLLMPVYRDKAGSYSEPLRLSSPPSSLPH